MLFFLNKSLQQISLCTTILKLVKKIAKFSKTTKYKFWKSHNFNFFPKTAFFELCLFREWCINSKHGSISIILFRFSLKSSQSQTRANLALEVDCGLTQVESNQPQNVHRCKTSDYKTIKNYSRVRIRYQPIFAVHSINPPPWAPQDYRHFFSEIFLNIGRNSLQLRNLISWVVF